MDIMTLADAPAYDADQVVAGIWMTADQCNVRLIRLSPGQVLPPHTHGASDLMLYVIEGSGLVHADDDAAPCQAGSLAYIAPNESLTVHNDGTTGMTLLAFLAPPFPSG